MYPPPPRPSYVMSIFNWSGCHCVALASCFCRCRHCLPCPLHCSYHCRQSKNCWIRTASSTSPRGCAGQPTRTAKPLLRPLDVRVFVCIIVLAYVPSLSVVAALLVLVPVTLTMIPPVVVGRQGWRRIVVNSTMLPRPRVAQIARLSDIVPSVLHHPTCPSLDDASVAFDPSSSSSSSHVTSAATTSQQSTFRQIPV